ncbi:MAG: hypothetical protein ABUS49_00475, partial [Acidobacteriota bacterium]
RTIRPFIKAALAGRPLTTRLDPADREWLTNYYREDVRALADLLSRNGWAEAVSRVAWLRE